MINIGFNIGIVLCIFHIRSQIISLYQLKSHLLIGGQYGKQQFQKPNIQC